MCKPVVASIKNIASIDVQDMLHETVRFIILIGIEQRIFTKYKTFCIYVFIHLYAKKEKLSDWNYI